MFWFWTKSSWKLWLWNSWQLAWKIGLSSMKLNKIFKIEAQRYVNSKRSNYWKDYKFTANELKYGGTPIYDWFHDKRQMFREESAKFLINKHWSTYWF